MTIKTCKNQVTDGHHSSKMTHHSDIVWED